jgi:hypothetical protein
MVGGFGRQDGAAPAVRPAEPSSHPVRASGFWSLELLSFIGKGRDRPVWAARWMHKFSLADGRGHPMIAGRAESNDRKRRPRAAARRGRWPDAGETGFRTCGNPGSQNLATNVTTA